MGTSAGWDFGSPGSSSQQATLTPPAGVPGVGVLCGLVFFLDGMDAS
jgi:hypothetical protein